MGVQYQSLINKTALVTSGSRGIGRACCELLAANGVSVVVQYHKNVAAKAGLLGLTFSIVKELGSYGITANLVSPGRILTDMLIPHIPNRIDEWPIQTPLKRFGEPEEVASAIVFLASGEASYISGANIHINGGLVMG